MFFGFDSTTRTITDYYISGGLDVVIPPTIGGVPVEHIDDLAFFFPNNSLTSIVIPYGVISIGASAFLQNNSLTSVTIPNSVTSIGDQAFNGNQLTSIDIPDHLTYIGTYTFGHNELTEVTIPTLVATINENAFYGNYITSITIGANVTINDTKSSAMGICSASFMAVYDYNGTEEAGTYIYNSEAFPHWFKE